MGQEVRIGRGDKQAGVSLETNIRELRLLVSRRAVVAVQHLAVYIQSSGGATDEPPLCSVGFAGFEACVQTSGKASNWAGKRAAMSVSSP